MGNTNRENDQDGVRRATKQRQNAVARAAAKQKSQKAESVFSGIAADKKAAKEAIMFGINVNKTIDFWLDETDRLGVIQVPRGPLVQDNKVYQQAKEELERWINKVALASKYVVEDLQNGFRLGKRGIIQQVA